MQQETDRETDIFVGPMLQQLVLGRGRQSESTQQTGGNLSLIKVHSPELSF